MVEAEFLLGFWRKRRWYGKGRGVDYRSKGKREFRTFWDFFERMFRDLIV